MSSGDHSSPLPGVGQQSFSLWKVSFRKLLLNQQESFPTCALSHPFSRSVSRSSFSSNEPIEIRVPQPFTLEFIPSRKTLILNCIEVVIAH